jgi:hypothetical protein
VLNPKLEETAASLTVAAGETIRLMSDNRQGD